MSILFFPVKHFHFSCFAKNKREKREEKRESKKETKLFQFAMHVVLSDNDAVGSSRSQWLFEC